MRKYFKKQKGFTLVELLIVVAILGILAAVVIPNVVGATSTAKTSAASAELTTIQTAMDTMMAMNKITSVNVTAATSNMAAFPSGSPLYPTYLRTATAHGTYSCDATGLVTQATYP